MPLTLDRKPGERIVIDGPCVIEVARIRGNRARIAIEAESHVSIVREELLDVKPRMRPEDRDSD